MGTQQKQCIAEEPPFGTNQKLKRCNNPSNTFVPMQKRISLLLIFAFLVTPVVAQQEARRKSQGGAGANETAQRKAEESQRKMQAIDILKGVVESAAEIQEIRTRLTVLTGASIYCGGMLRLTRAKTS